EAHGRLRDGKIRIMATVPHFQEELDQLKARLLEMGGLAEDRVRSAVKALVDRDPSLVERVLGGDGPINQLHIEIDSRCVTLLAQKVLDADDGLDALKT